MFTVLYPLTFHKTQIFGHVNLIKSFNDLNLQIIISGLIGFSRLRNFCLTFAEVDKREISNIIFAKSLPRLVNPPDILETCSSKLDVFVTTTLLKAMPCKQVNLVSTSWRNTTKSFFQKKSAVWTLRSSKWQRSSWKCPHENEKPSLLLFHLNLCQRVSD